MASPGSGVHGPQDTARKRALVVGGGFAGVEAATALQRAGGFDVTLVSDRDYLYLFPISVWVPVRGIPIRRAQVSLHDIARKRGFRVVVDSVDEIRSGENVVRGTAGTYRHDYLVVAMGAGKLKPQGARSTSRSCASWTRVTARP